MKFSLVLATKNRVEEVNEFLNSLLLQSYNNFELIIVDQNEDDRLISTIKKFKQKFKIKYFRSNPGLSCSRNIGLKNITGDIVAFPDDDCQYPVYLLEFLNNKFSENATIAGVTGKSVNDNLEVNNGKFGNKASKINIYSVWNSGISYTIFLKRNVINKVGEFDTKLGVGANTKWQSAEETDYLIRSIKNNFLLMYDPNIQVIHPNPSNKYSKDMQYKTYRYALGMGHVLKKHEYNYLFVFKVLFRPFLGMAFFLIQLRLDRSIHSWNVFRGRLVGFLS